MFKPHVGCTVHLQQALKTTPHRFANHRRSCTKAFEDVSDSARYFGEDRTGGTYSRYIADNERLGLVRLQGGYLMKVTNEASTFQAQQRMHLHLIDYLERKSRRRRSSLMACISDESAAVMWDLPLLCPPPQRVKRVAPYPQRISRGKLHDTRQATKHFATDLIANIQVTSLEQTIVDLSRHLGPEHGLAAANSAAHRQILDYGRFEDIVKALGGSSGVRWARRVLELVDSRIESVGESLTLWRLIEAGISAPQIQPHLIIDGATYRPDFLWPELGIIIEFDGRMKLSAEILGRKTPGEALFEERNREILLRSYGFRVYRLEWKDVQSLAAFKKWMRRNSLTLPRA